MKFYSPQYEWDDALDLYGVPPFDLEMQVLDEDTFTIAQQEQKAGCLNFASHKRPGGGYKAVMNGPIPIRTQEEDLFRRSNLPELMDNEKVREHYPLKGINGFYCVATVHKDKYLQPIEPFETGIITVPAVVNPSPEPGTPAGRSYDLVEAKVHRILSIAQEERLEVLILGAWGCGIFNNPPRHIAELFVKHLTGQFDGSFRKAIFGVPGAKTENHKIFKEVIGG